MKRKIFMIALALCLCCSSLLPAYAGQKISSLQEGVSDKEPASEPAAHDDIIPTPQKAYKAMIALKEQEAYKEGTTWTNYEPYSNATGNYRWKGGALGGSNILAAGCVAFAFVLSDTAFGSLPARMYEPGQFTFEDIKVGDILRVNTDNHTVIVLEKSDGGVILAEGNFNGKVHWGRAMSKSEVMRDTSHYITRYPEGYLAPDDPDASITLAEGTFGAGLAWHLTKTGILTISGNGTMPMDFSGPGDQPWGEYGSQIHKIIIKDGITGIGSSAFYNNTALSVEIPSSVTTIGNNAFYGSSLISVSIPSSVKTIGNDAFRQCPNLTSVTVSEGVETIGERAFRGCTQLSFANLPSSITKMGAGAFYDCTELLRVTFASGGSHVTVMGDNLFSRCWRLFDVTLPSKIDCISAGMFQNCLKLYGVHIPQSAVKIGSFAFASCTGLTNLIIPDSITDIELGAFANCSLANVYFTGTKAQWNNIWKSADVIAALNTVAIEYEYNPDSDDSGNTTPEPAPSVTPSQEPTPSVTPSQEPTPSVTPSGKPEPIVMPTQPPAPTEANNPNPPEAVLGDLNGDDKVDLKDAQFTLKAALHIIALTPEQEKAADVNYDNRVDLKDAQTILKAALHITTLTPEQMNI